VARDVRVCVNTIGICARGWRSCATPSTKTCRMRSRASGRHSTIHLTRRN
jgi:hypothetical protein